MKGRVTEKRFGKWGVVPKDVVSKYAELLGVAAKIPDVSGFLTDAFTPGWLYVAGNEFA